MGPSTSGGSNANSNPPAGFDPAPPPGPFDPNNNNPFEVHWNFETDNGTYQGKSPEQLQEEREQVEWIKEMVVVVGGSVILGYATGGYSIYVQVASSSIWSGGTAYYYAKDDKMQSSAESAVQDGIIAGANPLGPVGNAVVSPIITEIREQIPARPYQTPRERLEYIADPRPRPLH